MVSFGFHPALKVTKITDENGKLLTGERSADGTIRVSAGHALCQGPDVSLDLRVRRRDHRERRRPGGRPEAGRHPGADHVSALPGALVPHHRLHDRPLHRGDAHQGAAGDAGVCQRSDGRVASRNAGQRQAGRPVRLQLEQARISGNASLPAAMWIPARQGPAT